MGEKKRKRSAGPKPDWFALCYLCERHVGPSVQRDHFPRSFANGGEAAHPVCISCHDLKDRVELNSWPDAVRMKAALGLYRKASDAEVALLVGLLEQIQKQERGELSWHPELASVRLGRLWTKAEGMERLLLAKMIHVLNMAEAEIQKRRGTKA